MAEGEGLGVGFIGVDGDGFPFCDSLNNSFPPGGEVVIIEFKEVVCEFLKFFGQGFFWELFHEKKGVGSRFFVLTFL